MCVDHGLSNLIQLAEIGFHQRNRAGCLAVRICVDKDGGFVSILQRIREIETANAEIDDADAWRENLQRTRRFTTSTPNPSSPKKIFPIPAIRIFEVLSTLCVRASSRRQGLNFRRIEKETVPRLAKHAEIASGIVFQHDADVILALIILLDAFDDGGLTGQGDIQDIASLAADAGERGLQPSLQCRR